MKNDLRAIGLEEEVELALLGGQVIKDLSAAPPVAIDAKGQARGEIDAPPADERFTANRDGTGRDDDHEARSEVVSRTAAGVFRNRQPHQFSGAIGDRTPAVPDGSEGVGDIGDPGSGLPDERLRVRVKNALLHSGGEAVELDQVDGDIVRDDVNRVAKDNPLTPRREQNMTRQYVRPSR